MKPFILSTSRACSPCCLRATGHCRVEQPRDNKLETLRFALLQELALLKNCKWYYCTSPTTSSMSSKCVV